MVSQMRRMLFCFRWVAATSSVFLLFPSGAKGQTVKVYVSSKAGDRLTPRADLQFSDAQPAAREAGLVLPRQGAWRALPWGVFSIWVAHTPQRVRLFVSMIP